MKNNSKSFIIVFMAILSVLALLLISCNPPVEPVDNPLVQPGEPLFNESINEELENLTNPETLPSNQPKEPPKEFFFNYSERNESKYEIAEVDVFTLTKGDFLSTDLSFLGLMIGDSYDDVVDILGIPDVTFIPADESYMNIEYEKKIGIINGSLSGISFHLEDDIITRITVKTPFNKYLHGNTTLGQTKYYIYEAFDVPDYQDFIGSYKVFYYVSKGVEFYFRGTDVDRMSFVQPVDFKGVEYVRVKKEIAPGMYAEVIEPVIKE